VTQFPEEKKFPLSRAIFYYQFSDTKSVCCKNDFSKIFSSVSLKPFIFNISAIFTGAYITQITSQENVYIIMAKPAGNTLLYIDMQAQPSAEINISHMKGNEDERPKGLAIELLYGEGLR
jgi:hypothetical protein